MTYLNLNNTTDLEFIVAYVLEVRGRGLFLADSDVTCICQWLAALNGQREALLALLSEALPSFYQTKKGQNRTPSLQLIHKKIMKNISSLNCSGLTRL